MAKKSSSRKQESGSKKKSPPRGKVKKSPHGKESFSPQKDFRREKKTADSELTYDRKNERKEKFPRSPQNEKRGASYREKQSDHDFDFEDENIERRPRREKRERPLPAYFPVDTPSPNLNRPLEVVTESKSQILEEELVINQLPDPRVAEELLIKHAPKMTAYRMLCTTLGRGQLAGLLANLSSKRNVICHTLDYFQCHLMETYFKPLVKNLEVICTPNFPDVQAENLFDVVCIPVTKTGNAELTRDLLQQGCARLKPEGELWTAVDQPQEVWLNGELKKLFTRITCFPYEQGVVYRAVKENKPSRLRDFTSQYKVRDQKKLLTVESVPGVFGHREIDLGARALMEGMEIHDHERVLDIGCGTGICGLTAMTRAQGVSLVACDSHARAVACTLRNAELNQLENVRVILDYDGSRVPETEFDVVLANPPYYSHFKISKIFVDTAHRLLAKKGRLYLVTKLPDWYRAYLPLLFDKIEVKALRGYFVFTAGEPVENTSCPDILEED